MKKLFMQIIKFGLVGVIATVIDYVLLYVLTEFFNIYYLISSIISFSVSVIFNYIASVRWVFDVDKNKNSKVKELVVFIILSVIGLGINQLFMWLLSDKLNIYYMISKLFATVVVMCWNFITRKLFLENNKKD